MQRYPQALIRSAVRWRSKGFTYPEILKKLDRDIPKGTLSSWLSGVQVPSFYLKKTRRLNLDALATARGKAATVNRDKKLSQLSDIHESNKGLVLLLKQKSVAKLFLAALYLGEGAKKNKGFLTFANSDPGIISVFLKLLRSVYSLDETSLRCTLLCRADQNISELNDFWSKVTGVPNTQFYKARVDARTLGKATKNTAYKGVCRIDLFSAKIYDELKIIGNIVIQANKL